ncbi:redox-sensing transcriptional repressor Rex [Aerococcus kribbianus]|uniref:Redox-sensing transcriptional repressor Rex n=1 Tax=Aerococcus kribbianus TaxID=2999064 RepID=A0A9X3JFX9_9LACT|nr:MULTISPECIES: redox-sensing transcriptional repressor Rex [unclassified Aerococcus]MCZ0717517.1 redox-sensing transcriptional repressor Rex [Aerococcus sp. YH-aer221]MCZ0725805.1 redox-sensing transcriptional repressor Rex [Aerococcus sp. YH-aer222]
MKEIPKATAKRLPLYHRYLKMFHDMGKLRISSTELSEAVKVDSATIRRDLSYFGALGKRGYGYDIEYLLNFFSRTLSQDRLQTVALIGVGNLGNALLNYNFKKSNNVHIGAAFDINEDIVGTVHNGVPIYPMSDLQEQLDLMDIEVVIITVPENAVQKIIPDLEKAGVKGIFNFTPVRLDVSEGIHVQNVDLVNELQTLIYYINASK